LVFTLTEYGAEVCAAPAATPSTWNSTLATPTLSAAVALKVSGPVMPLAKLTGVETATVGAWVSAPGGGVVGGVVGGAVTLLSPPQEAAETTTARSIAQRTHDHLSLIEGSIQLIFCPLTAASVSSRFEPSGNPRREHLARRIIDIATPIEVQM